MFVFVVFDLVFMPSYWLERTSSKWRILCRLGRKTSTQSISIG